ncbi:MAG: flagellar FlbD family protein [Tissierellia bacterium]|jgi:flagellar protein FlbD|nr:flagellar FlbD family protein [Tissierellia bacterium]
MIKLTSISGDEFCLNIDLIYKIEELPDTVITLTNGKTIRVNDKADDIIQKVIDFKRKIYQGVAEVSSN